MSTVIVIPARKGSSRFPGKPLALIEGRPLLERTYRIARAVPGVQEVYIATDDHEIRSRALEWGAQVLMTGENCRNGSERAFQAVQGMSSRPEIIVNLQGDAVLTPPWVIHEVISKISSDQKISIATPATHLNSEQYDQFVSLKKSGRVSGTLVVFDRNFKALYFSKTMIPHLREKSVKGIPVFRHIGLYAYRYQALENYCQLESTPLEETEGLEQLRALENGIPIQIVPVDYRGRTHWSVDHPEDIRIVEKIIQAEGDLA